MCLCGKCETEQIKNVIRSRSRCVDRAMNARVHIQTTPRGSRVARELMTNALVRVYVCACACVYVSSRARARARACTCECVRAFPRVCASLVVAGARLAGRRAAPPVGLVCRGERAPTKNPRPHVTAAASRWTTVVGGWRPSSAEGIA